MRIKLAVVILLFTLQNFCAFGQDKVQPPKDSTDFDLAVTIDLR